MRTLLRTIAVLLAALLLPLAVGVTAGLTAGRDQYAPLAGTARWTAKVLEYPLDDLRLSGPAWPWAVTLPPVLLALAGLVVLVALARVLQHHRSLRGRAERAPTGRASRPVGRPRVPPRTTPARPFVRPTHPGHPRRTP